MESEAMGWRRESVMVAVALWLTSTALADDVQTAGDYVSILPGRIFPDRSIGTTGHGVSMAVGYGRSLRDRWGFEAHLGGEVLETGDDGGTDFYQQFLTVDLAYSFLQPRSDHWTPFVLVGAGGARDDRFPDSRDGAAFLLEAGAGVVSPRFFSDRVALRAEARYVHDNREGGHGEPRVSLGIEIPLGRVVRTVEQVPVEKIVERVVIKEVERAPADADGDGVDDSRDRCPDTPRGLRVDANGCAIVNQAIELRGVTFELDQSRLTPNAQTVLDGVARAFTGQPSLRVEIAGHTDSSGSAAYNMNLSQRRADSVRAYLMSRGASEAQLSARGYGESQLLIDPEKSQDDRERNRRVEFRVVGGQ